MAKRGRPESREDIDGKKLKDLMESQHPKLNNSTLAKAVNISRPVIVDALRENKMNPEFIERIANYFHVDPGWIMGRNNKKLSEGSAGDQIYVDNKIRGYIDQDGSIVLDADSYKNFIEPPDFADPEGKEIVKKRWEARFEKTKKDGYAVPPFKPLDALQKEDALPYLEKLLKTPYMSAAWKNIIDDQDALISLLESLKDYGYQLSLKKKEEKE